MTTPSDSTRGPAARRREPDEAGHEVGGRRLWLARSELLKPALFIGSALLVVAGFLFAQQMINRLSNEVATTSHVLARLCAQASFPATRDTALRKILGDVISSIDFPIVITDNGRVPRAWRHVGLDPALVPDASLDSLSAGMKIAPVIAARVERVKLRLEQMAERNAPIVMVQPENSMRLGYVFYGEPPVMERLRWMPLVSLGGLILLVSIGLWGLSGIRQAERRSIWVGMARETAHQLGTPLSSLLGWIELLRGHVESARDPVPIPRAELTETLDDMERDVERLTKVAQRFSRVGSAPALLMQDITPAVRAAVLYVQRRLPRGEGEIVLRERYEEVPPVNLNSELVEWAVENLLINAVSAIDRRPGLVEVVVELRRETETVEVIIRDNGRGMTLAEQRRAFEPGFTTKRRGWGLGLALARRVVEEYHGGRIVVRHSAPGDGTTMVMCFPT